MIKVKKIAIALAVTAGFCSINSMAKDAAPLKNDAAVTQVKNHQLAQGNWDKFNRDQLDNMIATYGKTSKNYDPKNPPYAVFDWDNTSVFLDIQEALIIYQLEHLNFKMTPETLNTVIRMNVPKTDFSSDDNNTAGKAVNIDQIAQDIVNSYTWIYNNYDQMKGNKSFAEIKKSEQYKEFSTKLRYLYSAIGNSFDVSISYPWATYLFTGLTENDIAKMTAETVEWQKNQPVEDVTWISPAVESKAGQVKVTWHNGLRLVPEMQDLYAKLRESGIDVWVCSASFIDVIKEVSSNPKFGYNNPKENVIAMELERDVNGVIQPEYRKGYTQTQGPGKTVEIKRLIAPKYNNKGPILVAGDSEGDQNMFQDFKDTNKVIIVNRLKSPSTDIGKFSKEAVDTYQKPEAKFLLQGRDENTGLYTGSQKTIKLGSKEGKALK